MAGDGTAATTLRQTNFWDYNANYTVAGWWKPAAAASRQGIFAICDAVGGNDQEEYDQDYLAANRVYINSVIGGVNTRAHGSTATVNGTWYYFVLRRTGVAALDFRMDTTSQGSVTNNITGRTAPTEIRLFYGFDSVTPLNGSMNRVRVWTTNLTDGELATERGSATVVKTASLWANWVLASSTDTSDISGNGRNWSKNGGTGFSTDADDPTFAPTGPTVAQYQNALEASRASGGRVGLNRLRL